MLGLLYRDQKTLVVLLWLILLGNLLWENCCTVRTKPLILNGRSIPNSRSAQAEASSSSNNTSSNNTPETADPIAPYRIPGSEVLMPFRIEINTAPAEELQILPGVGPALSKNIVEWRQTHGLFRQIEDIKLVPGIGPKKYDVMKKFIYIQKE